MTYCEFSSSRIWILSGTVYFFEILRILVLFENPHILLFIIFQRDRIKQTWVKRALTTVFSFLRGGTSKLKEKNAVNSKFGRKKNSCTILKNKNTELGGVF